MRLGVVVALAVLLVGRAVRAQTPPTTAPVLPPSGQGPNMSAASDLAGRIVRQVRVMGNVQVPSAVILNDIRTRTGQPFDPDTVVEDYQRIYTREKRFTNVEARVETVADGVIVIFQVSEQRQIRTISFKGNSDVKTQDIENVVDLKIGQAIDAFRINVARQAIEHAYHDQNFPFAHVNVDQDQLGATGDLVFNIVEGPRVRVRKVAFVGNKSFSDWKLNDQVKTKIYLFIFQAGTFDPEQVDEDVDSLRKFYRDKGFFDVRVGRILSFGPDQTELQVTFVIDEGPRYIVDHIRFEGNALLTDAELRKPLNLVEGQPYDADVVQRDTREMVHTYSPKGVVYDPTLAALDNPDYLHIDPKEVFHDRPGHLDLVYTIHEGRAFHIGRILVKGNDKTQEKVILREMRVSPGQLYDSSEIQDAQDRLRGTPYFKSVVITPIGTDPEIRDLLVEVTEAPTAKIEFGAGFNTNGGVAGNIGYEQKNFDIANIPTSASDLLNERAFTGAGQDFKINFQPGTISTNAVVSFTEPYLFDQPFSFNAQAYLSDYVREVFTDRRTGGQITIGHSFDYLWSAAISVRAENVTIDHVEDRPDRSSIILDGTGHHVLDAVGGQIRRDSTNHGPITYKGDDLVFGAQQYGALGGPVQFTRLNATWDNYTTLYDDLLDRRTVLNTHLYVGDDLEHAPFYENFYGGGIGSIRGFAYRGISPRNGVEEDAIGGDFAYTGGVELGYPIAADILRGVVFFDAGDIESNVHFGVLRSSVGAGIRLIVPFLSENAPIALDFGVPVTRNRQDELQLISFSIGLTR